ncbi:hypothetical protein AB0N05_05380 [Nocardia sp. NPDC051030]|uniref:hypothetical protein n=1 Tax=Nocardia sp. NPDC051030 TaxID=3155162 RepID=UPI003437E8A6
MSSTGGRMHSAAGQTSSGAPRAMARRLLSGCGAVAVAAQEPTRREQHRLLIEAVLSDMSGQTVVSHQSAAVLYGTTLWRTPLDQVCLTRNRRGGGRTRPFTRIHGSPVDSAMEIDGLRVTTPARTVVDLALTLPLEEAVVAGDSLVGAFGLTGEELHAEVARARCRHGITQAKQVIGLLDGRSQGVGESLSRVMIHRLRLPLPRSQGNVLTPDGRFVGQVDFYYEKAGVLCEFDGQARYGRVLRPGQDLAVAMQRERTREDYLRALGFQVVRWTWSDLCTGVAGRRLRAALARERRARPDGRIEPAPATEPRRMPVHPL